MIDVREESEYCDETSSPSGHMPGAVNYPWASSYLQAHYSEIPQNKILVVTCLSGVRSARASQFLCSQGFNSVYNMLGGMLSWQWDTVNCCFSDADCDDGLFCTGRERCLDLNCKEGEFQCAQPYFMCDEDNNTCVECPDDSDCDGVMDFEDNCFMSTTGMDIPNGPFSGTCVKDINGVMVGTWMVCNDDIDCAGDEMCEKDQADYNLNGAGDVCECYADIDGTGEVCLFDLLIMKSEFGSSGCTPQTCQADIDGNGGVDLFDLLVMKAQFGKTNCPIAP